jgi:phenylalanyl-tRNA synthetase beta chain
MKTSINWLRSYIDIPWTPQELAARLTAAGLEVEGIEITGQIPDGVIVAEILSRNPHTNSEHLSVCMVNSGQDEPLQIVCGAPNCDAGQKVPLATVGTRFADGQIKKAKIRGVESHGMLCSARELGLGEDHEGLMILPADTPLGMPLGELVEEDTVIDWEVTPNRPDWLSHIGIAREIAAVAQLPLREPAAAIRHLPGSSVHEHAKVSVLDSDLCPRYIARVFKNVKVGPSPAWMVKQLAAVGLRSVNNVVDITNYVMLEYGQPLHAFDLSTLAGSQIIVRRAQQGEKITTLDGSKLSLTPEHLLIADRDKGVALAGIMGGENSMISDTTSTVLLEAAAFERSNIRVSSRNLGIATDSSHRFERGVSPETTARASARAAALLCELCGAEQLEGVIDCYGKTWHCPEISLRVQRCNALLGLQLDTASIASCLQRRGMSILSQDDELVCARAPAWRFDLHAEHDLIEEVAQISGLDAIPTAPVSGKISGAMKDDRFLPLEDIRREFQALGLDEIINYSLWSLPQCLLGSSFQEEEILKVANPISIDTAFLRPTLLPGLLQVVARNVAHNEHQLRLFELGRVFRKSDGRYCESNQAAIAISGKRHPERFGSDLAAKLDFYDLKGLLASWMQARHIGDCSWQSAESPACKAGACASLSVQGKNIATFGEAAPALTKGIRLRAPLFIALIDVDALLKLRVPAPSYSPIAQFPSTSRDISFVAPAGLSHQQVVDTIRALQLPLVDRIELFDSFSDEKVLGKGRNSLAYSVTFRHQERTLTDDEVNALQTKIREALAEKLGVELR